MHSSMTQISIDPDARLWGWLRPDEPDLFAQTPGLDAWLARELGLEGLKHREPVPFDPHGATSSRLSAAARQALRSRLGEQDVDEDLVRRAHVSLGQSYGDQLVRRGGRIARVCDAVVSPHRADAVLDLLEL